MKCMYLRKIQSKVILSSIFYLTFMIFLVLPNARASVVDQINYQGIVLHPGDVVILSLNCYLCRLIELEEKAPFSHSGLIVFDSKNHSWGVAQSLHGVEVLPLEKFWQQKKVGSSTFILRSKELEHLAQESLNLETLDPISWEERISPFQELTQKLWGNFDKKFKGKSFDSRFLWDNRDDRGEELLYCSEMVAKLLNTILERKILPRPMHFHSHRRDWERFFQGQVPDGLPGLAPSDFARSPDFTLVGKL